jgi:hypothetical protein
MQKIHPKNNLLQRPTTNGTHNQSAQILNDVCAVNNRRRLSSHASDQPRKTETKRRYVTFFQCLAQLSCAPAAFISGNNSYLHLSRLLYASFMVE